LDNELGRGSAQATGSGMVNTFLFLAYSFVWLIFMLYAWNLSRRHERLRRELEDLKAKVENRQK